MDGIAVAAAARQFYTVVDGIQRVAVYRLGEVDVDFFPFGTGVGDDERLGSGNRRGGFVHQHGHGELGGLHIAAVVHFEEDVGRQYVAESHVVGDDLELVDGIDIQRDSADAVDGLVGVGDVLEVDAVVLGWMENAVIVFSKILDEFEVGGGGVFEGDVLHIQHLSFLEGGGHGVGVHKRVARAHGGYTVQFYTGKDGEGGAVVEDDGHFAGHFPCAEGGSVGINPKVGEFLVGDGGQLAGIVVGAVLLVEGADIHGDSGVFTEVQIGDLQLLPMAAGKKSCKKSTALLIAALLMVN